MLYGRRRLVKALPDVVYVVRVSSSHGDTLHGPYGTRAGARTVASNKRSYWESKRHSVEWANNYFNREEPEPLPEVPTVTIFEMRGEWTEVND